jgi:hypothetical protein
VPKKPGTVATPSVGAKQPFSMHVVRCRSRLQKEGRGPASGAARVGDEAARGARIGDEAARCDTHRERSSSRRRASGRSSSRRHASGTTSVRVEQRAAGQFTAARLGGKAARNGVPRGQSSSQRRTSGAIHGGAVHDGTPQGRSSSQRCASRWSSSGTEQCAALCVSLEQLTTVRVWGGGACVKESALVETEENASG